MALRCWGFTAVVSYLLAQACSQSAPAFAIPKANKVTFASPIGSVQTVQVTIILYDDVSGPVFGRLHRLGMVTLHIQPGDKWRYRADWKQNSPDRSTGYFIVDEIAGTKAYCENGKLYSSPTSYGFWFDPLTSIVGRINGYRRSYAQEMLTAVPAKRDGKKVLVTSTKQSLPGTRVNSTNTIETWYNPQTHLPIRYTAYKSIKGKTQEIMRVEYYDWVLNRPLLPTLFAIPSSVAKQKN